MANYGFNDKNGSEEITFSGSGGGTDYKYDPASHSHALIPSGQQKELVGYGQGGGYWTDSHINLHHGGPTDKIVGGVKTVGKWYVATFYIKPYKWVRERI